MTRAKKTTILVIATPIVALSLLVLALSFDGPAPDDSDLLFVYAPIPPETNGFSRLVFAGELAFIDHARISRCQAAKRWSKEAAEMVVQENAQAFDEWEKGMLLPSLQVPRTAIESDMAYVMHWQSLATLLAINARLLAEQGKPVAALEQAVRIVDFGFRIEGPEGGRTTDRTAKIVKSIGLQTIRRIYHECEVPTDALTGAVERLEPFVSNRKSFQDSLRVRYTWVAETLDAIGEGTCESDPSHIVPGDSWAICKIPFLFKRNTTKSLFVDSYSIYLANSALPYHDRQLHDVRPPTLTTLLFSGNSMGHIIYSSYMPWLNNEINRLDQLDVEVHATRLMLAIKAYRNEHGGTWPMSLDDLVPTCVRRLPVDPYSKTAAPLKYSVERKTVYTIGRDGKDNGGMIVDGFVRVRDSGEHARWNRRDPGYLLDRSILPKEPELAAEPDASTDSLDFFGGPPKEKSQTGSDATPTPTELHD